MQHKNITELLRIFICFVVLCLLFTSCGRERAETTQYYGYDQIHEETYTVYYEPTVGSALTEMQLLLLEDLDYFLHVMETDFCLFDVQYWARGVDIRAYVEIIREEILSTPNMTVDEFFNLLYLQFPHSEPTGLGAHFRFVCRGYYRGIYYNRASWHWQAFCGSSLARLSHPHVREFYGRRMNITRGLMAYGSNLQGASRGISIEEGRIAYMSIGSFFNWHSYSLERYLEFYESIQGYEHLIIDISNNRGGHVQYFFNAVIQPNISETLHSNAFMFFSIGNYNLEHTAFRVRRNYLGRYNAFEGRISVAELLASYDLPDINMADMERMEYVYRLSAVITPMRLSRFNYQPAFDGKIWLLTGPGAVSGGEYAARISKNSGFATLVGERTGGQLGNTRIFVGLPNTGILFQMDLFYPTDRHGRPFDAGTYPHHFTRPGLTALETTLQLIAEGNY